MNVDDTTLSTSYTLSKGGIYSCSGTGSANISFTDSSTSDSKASGSGNNVKYGGVFHVSVTQSITMVLSNSVFTQQTADSNGGFAYLVGNSLTGNILSKT